MRVFTLFDHEIHDHYIIIGVFGLFIGIVFVNDYYIDTTNCHILEPTLDCTQRGMIDKSLVINNPQFVYIPYWLSFYHLDEFRQQPQYGFEHVECIPFSNSCTYHYDTFNALPEAGAFSMIGHAADTIATSSITVSVFNSGLPDWPIALTIWAIIVFGGYYSIRTVYLHVRG